MPVFSHGFVIARSVEHPPCSRAQRIAASLDADTRTERASDARFARLAEPRSGVSTKIRSPPSVHTDTWPIVGNGPAALVCRDSDPIRSGDPPYNRRLTRPACGLGPQVAPPTGRSWSEVVFARLRHIHLPRAGLERDAAFDDALRAASWPPVPEDREQPETEGEEVRTRNEPQRASRRVRKRARRRPDRSRSTARGG